MAGLCHTSVMARFGDFEFAVGLSARAATFWTCALCLALFSGNALDAQDDDITTLHAYANLVQIPVLVLNQDREPIPPIAERKFFVSLDGGPQFRVTNVRLEGDDPISLAILLDLSQPDPGVMDKIDEVIASLSPLYVHATDRTSIYSLDCRLIRSTDATKTDSANLKKHVNAVLRSWKVRGRKRVKGDCQTPWHLWDALVSVTAALREQPGRRVILVVTDGVDRGSKISWNIVRDFAQESSVAIFGVQRADTYGFNSASLELALVRIGVLNSICELTGGMVLMAGEIDLAKQLKHTMTLVRGRYIAEFPRPIGAPGGHHDMQFSIEETDAFIRSTGVGVPVYDPALSNDPMTIPPDPSHAPAMGKPRVLTPY